MWTKGGVARPQVARGGAGWCAMRMILKGVNSAPGMRGWCRRTAQGGCPSTYDEEDAGVSSDWSTRNMLASSSARLPLSPNASGRGGTDRGKARSSCRATATTRATLPSIDHRMRGQNERLTPCQALHDTHGGKGGISLSGAECISLDGALGWCFASQGVLDFFSSSTVV